MTGFWQKERGQRFPAAPFLDAAPYQVNEVPREMKEAVTLLL